MSPILCISMHFIAAALIARHLAWLAAKREHPYLLFLQSSGRRRAMPTARIFGEGPDALEISS